MAERCYVSNVTGGDFHGLGEAWSDQAVDPPGGLVERAIGDGERTAAADGSATFRHGEGISMPTPVERHRRVLAITGVASLANGAALVIHILGGIRLPVLLAITWAIAVGTVVAFAGIGDPRGMAAIRRNVVVGLLAGTVAVLAYDATKAVLAQLDPSPYNPFAVTRIFGAILVGESAPPALITTVGWAFHLMNGCTFAIAYSCLFARDGDISKRRAVVTGVTWGLFLETFQLLLYPGWLKIGFLDEFRRISFSAHVVFGAGLGLMVPYGLRRLHRGGAR